MTDFELRDRVRAKLWPELGTGTVLYVTPRRDSSVVRVAKVHWPDANQTTKHSFSALAIVQRAADRGMYYCPASGEWELQPGGGFDVCCDAPERHVPLPPLEDRSLHVMSCDECRGDLDSHGHFPDCSRYRQEAPA